LKTASDATLWQHGSLLKRPGPSDHPATVAAWNKVCERGLRTIAPHLEPLPDTMRRVRRRPVHKPRGGSGGGQATSTNWCGCVLEGSGNWRSVAGTLTLPYLSVPSSGLQGNQPAALSAWVGLDGWSNNNTLFQTIINFSLDTTTNPPSAIFTVPTCQWWIPLIRATLLDILAVLRFRTPRR
jgi:hypothetical protein